MAAVVWAFRGDSLGFQPSSPSRSNPTSETAEEEDRDDERKQGGEDAESNEERRKLPVHGLVLTSA
eukprot:CAMPEP_0202828406 /NCGR_PEP_ID=MMETSP1389-20130828/14915_1 /ASSEMBLY_ACC=CAM_ASM_000865 /TAXON_ID=302021 /ORGANISM="Rhodomonas sp., Strain CCMP768" /LENGTH=65 /DNA_ID=CAMNT_0049501895 /DNA_START=229 /DNA_END=423 /DNA_ORIENTATION=-